MKEELGESTIKESEIDNLYKMIEKKNLPDNIKNRLSDEVRRYSLASQTSQEVSIIRSYIDWLLSLPWLEKQRDNYKIKDVMEILNETHYGLDDVKARIREYVAVIGHTNNINSPIYMPYWSTWCR